MPSININVSVINKKTAPVQIHYFAH